MNNYSFYMRSLKMHLSYYKHQKEARKHYKEVIGYTSERNYDKKRLFHNNEFIRLTGKEEKMFWFYNLKLLRNIIREDIKNLRTTSNYQFAESKINFCVICEKPIGRLKRSYCSESCKKIILANRKKLDREDSLSLGLNKEYKKVKDMDDKEFFNHFKDFE